MEPATLDILRHVAVISAEDIHLKQGWCRWSSGDDSDWEFDEYKPLVRAGLLEKRETYNDIFLRPTESGWRKLLMT